MMLKIASESNTKRGRRTGDKNSFVMTNFLNIADTATIVLYLIIQNILTFLGLLNIDYLIKVR